MEGIRNFFTQIFCSPLSEMNAWQLLLAVLLCALIVFVAYKIWLCIWKFLKLIFGGIKNKTSIKKKCQKIQCRHCGRTLDKCVCKDNEGKGNLYRLRHYRKETKALAYEKARREMEKEKR